MSGWSWPLSRAADDARAEADRLLAGASRALILEAEGDALYDAATDALEAWRRAEDRALLTRQLAEQEEGVYNAFEEGKA
jgi:hypothetical protein